MKYIRVSFVVVYWTRAQMGMRWNSDRADLFLLFHVPAMLLFCTAQKMTVTKVV
jgi:hypothetical protein